MLRDTRYSNEATRSTSSIQSNANHTLELAINYQPNVQPESFTESSQFPSQQYFPTHFDIQHHQMPPSYPEPLSIPDAPETGRKGAIRVGKRRKRVTEVEVPDNEWECVLCKVKAHMTPLKRRGEDGKRVSSHLIVYMNIIIQVQYHTTNNRISVMHAMYETESKKNVLNVE